MNYSLTILGLIIKRIIYLFSFLFISIFSGSLNAQPTQFNHYAVNDGLAQSVVLCIFQDSDGFIWLGTQNGLSRFNGYEFVNYFNEPGNPVSLSNSWIYDISEDSAGNLYLATKGGLNKFNKKTGEFTLVDLPSLDNAASNNFIYGVTSNNNFLYISSPPFLTIYNTITGESEVYKNKSEDDGAVHDIGSAVLCSTKGIIWMASHYGLISFDVKTKTFNNLLLGSEIDEANPNNTITAIFEEKNGNILAGTASGIFLINSEFNRGKRLTAIQNTLSSTNIRAIIRDEDNNLWIATEGGGLNMIRTDSVYKPLKAISYRNDQNFVSHDIIYSLFIDLSDNLWVGTIAGLDKANLKKSGIRIIANNGDPESYNLLDNVIASVYKDGSGRLWIGNWGTGLNILDKNMDKSNILHFKSEYTKDLHIPENHVHVIFEDSRGKIYIGTRNGVSVYSEGSESFIPVHEFYKNPDYNCFNNTRVYCMMEDFAGRLWIGTGNGIAILDIPNGTFETLRAGGEGGYRINSNLVYSIMQDKEGLIWIATSEGLNIYTPGSNAIISIKNDPDSSNTLCNDFTISLLQDKLGYIWIGTGSGLNRYSKSDSSFLYFSRKDGLPSEIIYNILEDKNGQIWLTTGQGLITIDPSKATQDKFLIIDQFKGKEFNLKAVFKSEDGELFFGSMDGLYSFYPDSLERNYFIPPVRITSIEKENDGKLEALNPYSDKLKLSYKDYAFTIEFAALDFTSPEKNIFAYQMEGLSDSWLKLGERRFVHFTNLPPGTYIFRVKATNSDGVWNENPTSLRISISPPWWASNYAFIGYFILLILLIILLISIREKNLRREKRRLEIEVERRTSEIARQKQFAEESEQKLRSTINSLDDIVFVLDEKGLLQEFYNPGHRDTHFIFPEMHMGKHFSEINFPDNVIIQFKETYEKFGEKIKVREFDHYFTDNHHIFWYNTKISPKINAVGKLTGLVVVARDITDRKESEKKLKQQKEELDELNTTKDRFFSILAHDLKNPFTNLYSLGDLLIKNYSELEEKDKYEGLQKMYKSSEFIYELLENLLTWSRSQRGKIEFNPSSFDLFKLIEVNLNLHKLSAESKGIMIINEVHENLQAYGDREMINTVVRNLINNAVKYSTKGGKITINAEENNGHYIVSIKDQGVGISEEDLAKLFRLDDKYKSKGTAGETGTGLGLVICKEFIEKHGEKLGCESKLGQGSRFYFTLATGKYQVHD